MNSLLETALAGHAAGLSIVPPRHDGSKAPLPKPWKPYQQQRPDPDQLKKWYSNGLTGIGVISGAVSGNLEAFEFDDADAYQHFKDIADDAGLGAVIRKLETGYIESSPGGGFHYLYRCPEIGGNAKLATRPDGVDEAGKPRIKTLIETRGEGGFIITAPSHGKVHPTGKPYCLLNGGFSTIPTLTVDERANLFTLARTFHVPGASKDQNDPCSQNQRDQNDLSAKTHERPGDAYNARASWDDLLIPQGWIRLFERQGATYWRRPGKSEGVSAATNWQGKGYLYVWSSSTPFATQKPISKFAAYAALEHGGDFKAATKALGMQGYGEPATKAKNTPGPSIGASTEETTPKKGLDRTLLNAVRFLSQNAWEGVIGYNEFRQQIEKRTATPYASPAGAWQDADTAETMIWINQTHQVPFGRETVDLAVMAVAHRNAFNPAQDRLRYLAAKWDGLSRLKTWLVDYLNATHTADNTHYLQEIGEKWLRGVAARVLYPGCKRDDVLVWFGPQGWRKSSAAQIIADAVQPEAFTDAIGDVSNPEAKINVRGIVIAELAELAAIKTASLEAIKSFVATRSDHFREKFGRYASDFPRTVSFVGTTNDPQFLRDPTGNRRFWPITLCAPIDTEALTQVVAQLLGEAAAQVIDKKPWYVSQADALNQAEEARSAHLEADAWTDAVMAAVDRLTGSSIGSPPPLTTGSILTGIGLRIDQQSNPAQKRLSGIMRLQGYVQKVTRAEMDWRKKIRVWVKETSTCTQV
jgi:predicted P-loop ATPase